MNKELAKKIVIIAVAAVCAGSIAVLGFTRPLTSIPEGGYAVGATMNVEKRLEAGDDSVCGLVTVEEDGMVYSGPLGYFAGEKRVPIDKTFPLYVNGGTTLRFLNEENWLISPEVNPVPSYDGLYLSNGHTYGADHREADLEEFILLTAGNSLYMNAQAAVFTNLIDSREIPVNSIIRFNETNIRWFSQEEGTLIYHEEENVFDSVITIGDHSYYYSDFIKALGIIKEGLEDFSKDRPSFDEKMEEAREILAESEEKAAGRMDRDSESTGREEMTGSGESGGYGSDTGSDQVSGGNKEYGKGGVSESRFAADEGEKPAGSAGGLGSSDGDEPRFKADTRSSSAVRPYSETPDPTSDRPYEKPTVSIGNLEPWCYAVTGHLYITDTAGVLEGNSIKITAFREVTGGGGSVQPYVNSEGYTAYPAYTSDGSTAYEGKSLQARIARNDDTDFAISPLPPSPENGEKSTVFIQLQYSYNALQGDGTYKKTTEYSDIVEIDLLKISECSLTPLLSDWNMLFAEYTNSTQVNGFTIKNVSGYDPEANFSIENFKLNIAPYVNRVEYTFSTEEGTEYISKVASRYINTAIDGENVNFEVPSDRSLPSNTKFRYSVTGYDKYDNAMDLLIGKNKETAVPSGTFTAEAYTRKAEPHAVMVNSVKKAENFTIKLTVTDLDDAIIFDDIDDSNKLQLVVNEVSTGTPAVISGTLDGEEFSLDDGIIYLPYKKGNARGEREYNIVIRSFAYQNTYKFDVYGSYDQQPDALKEETDPEKRVMKCYGALLQTKTFSTEQIDGFVAFDTECAKDAEGELLNNQHAAYIDYTLSSENDLDLLKTIDRYDLTLMLDKKEIETVKVSREAVNALPVDYLKDEYELIPRTPLKSGVYLVYTESGSARRKEVEEGKIWDALQPTEKPDEETGEIVTVEPILKIQVRTPDKDAQGESLKYLESFTKYTLSADSVIVQYLTPTKTSDYSIKTSVSMASFYTMRELPEVKSSEFYVGPESMTIKDLQILDKDETIKGGGIVYVYLYRGSNVIASRTVYTNKDPEDLFLDGLIKGIEYEIKFVAPFYDDSIEGATPQEKVIYDKVFRGSDSLYGDMNLEKLDYDRTDESARVMWLTPGLAFEEDEITGEKGFTRPSELDGNYVLNALEASKDDYTGEDKRTETWQKWISDPDHDGNILTEYFVLPDEGSTVRYLGSDLSSRFVDNGKYTKFYDKDRKLISSAAASSENPRVLVEVPENAKYVQLSFPDPDAAGDTTGFFDENKLELYYFLGEERENLWKEENFVKEHIINTDGTESSEVGAAYLKVAVEPGQIYHIDSGETVMMFSETMAYMGSTLTQIYNSPLEIPKNGGYMVINISDGDYTSKHLSLVSSVSGDDGSSFNSRISLTVRDENNYLGDEKKISVRVEKGYISGSEYSQAREYKDILLKKTLLDDGTCEYTATLDIENMEPEYAWKLTMYAALESSDVTLDTLEFSTDASCYLIRSNKDLKYISLYPFGNYLVVSDFENTLDIDTKFYGTIDFLGHKITRSGSDVNLIRYNYGIIRNLVYEFTGSSGSKAPVEINYGSMSSTALIISGDNTVSSYNSMFCQSNYGNISSFFVELGGDVILKNMSALLVCYNYGNVTGGYVYSTGESGVIFRRDIDSYGTVGGNISGILCYVNERGKFENIYITSDVWLDAESQDEEYPTNGSAIMSYVQGGIVRNIYFSGEEYAEIRKQTEEGEYEYSKGNTFVYTDHMFGTYEDGESKVYGSADVSNIWHVSRSTSKVYTCYHSFVREAAWAQLYDVEWQEQILGDAFDSEYCIGLNFYPRLTLPSYMDIYQGYTNLPSLDVGSRPELVSVSWAPEPYYSHKCNYGDILLKFYNPKNRQINSVTISGLGTFTKEGTTLDSGRIVDIILDSQATDKDGLWNVILRASVDEELGDQYLSTYMITNYTYDGGDDVAMSYKTSGFEFWKLIDRALESDKSTVSGAGAWSQINDNYTWNYIIAEDIDFAGVSEDKIRISGGEYYIDPDDTSGAFTGKINGEYNDRIHTLENINITGNGAGSNMPSVFRILSGGAQISNLIIDKMEIESSLAPYYNYAGFVGYAENTDTGTLAYFDDVHFTDSGVKGQGDVGLLAGYCSGLTIRNCSSGECTLDDIEGTAASYFGGLAGYCDEVRINNSYVRNLSAELNSNKTIQGSGGIVGNITGTGSDIVSCYSTGKLIVTGENTGGIAGNTSEEDYIHIDKCWSYVTLDTIGTHTGGVVGRLSYEVNNNLAVGSIYSTDTDYTHRITGRLPSSGELHRNFAYNKQYVTGKDETDYDGAFRMISPEEIIQTRTWAGIIGIGDGFDLHYVEGIENKDGKTYYYFPKVYAADSDGVSTETLVWGQDNYNLGIPSVTGEHTIEIDDALYTPAESTSGTKQNYKVAFFVNHPGYGTTEDSKGNPTNEFIEKFINGDVTLNIKGLGEASGEGDFGYSKLTTIESRGDTGETTFIEVNTADIYEIHSVYRLTLSYDDENNTPVELAVDIQFKTGKGEEVLQYYEISNWHDWCIYIVGRDDTDNYTLMSEKRSGWKTHGRTNENVKITGWIDMSQMANIPSEIFADFYGFSFDRLVGEGTNAGFGWNSVTEDKFIFNANAQGEPWITEVNTLLDNLTFEGIVVNLDNSDQTAKRDRSGFILNARKVTNITLKDVTMNVSSYNMNNLGFFSRVSSSIESCSMKDVSVVQTDPQTGTPGTKSDKQTGSYAWSDYGAALCAELYDGFKNVDAENITVELPNTRWVGAIAAYISNKNSESVSEVYSENTGTEKFTNLKVRGNHAVGGVVGYSYLALRHITVENIDVYAGAGDAGGVIGQLGMKSIWTDSKWITVKGGKVKAPFKKAGGVLGEGGSSNLSIKGGLRYCHVEGLEITGATEVGGVAGCIYDSGNANIFSYHEVIGCDITALNGNAGGIFANYACGYQHDMVVRDTRITASGIAGGIIAKVTLYGGKLYNCYVAEDVTIRSTGTGGYAGGIIGRFNSLEKDRYVYTGSRLVYDCACGADIYGETAGGITGYLERFNHGGTRYVKHCYFSGSIHAGKTAGGIIGSYYNFDDNSQTGTRTFHYPTTDNFDGNILTGSIWCEGEETDAAYNLLCPDGSEESLANAKAVTGTSYVCVWDDSYENTASMNIWNQAVINGRTVTADLSSAGETSFVSAAQLRDSSWWTGKGFSDKIWNLTDEGALETYMPYVRNSWAYIDTDFTTGPDLGVEMDFRMKSYSPIGGSWNGFFGAGNLYNCGWYSGYRTFYYGGGIESATHRQVYVCSYDLKHRLVQMNLNGDYRLKLYEYDDGGALKTTYDEKIETSLGSGSLRLFGHGAFTISSTDIYSVRITEGTGDAANYIPCCIGSRINCGFYDTVSKSFISTTSGVFAAGSEVPDAERNSNIPERYTQLEYVSVYGSLYYAEHDLEGNTVGIPLPPLGGNPDATKVYASGVDCLNIETTKGRTGVTVTFTGTSSSGETETVTDNYDADENGVISLTYDYDHDVTVDGVTYKAEDLRNTAMVDGDQWYFVDNSEKGNGALVNSYELLNSQLPDGLTGVPYIEGHGEEYIDTGYVPKYKETTMSIRFSVTERNEGTTYLFGSIGERRVDVNTFDALSCYLRADDGMFIANTYYGNTHKGLSCTNTDGTIYDVDMAVTSVTINGSVISMPTTSSYTISNPILLMHWTEPDGYADWEAAHMRIYDMVLYEDGEIIRHYVPAKIDGTGELGLYEVIENKFYGNASGKGAFTCDSASGDPNADTGDLPVEEDEEKLVGLPADYVQLEYLRSGGNQAINTDIRFDDPGKTYWVDMYYRLNSPLPEVSTGADTPMIFGNFKAVTYLGYNYYKGWIYNSYSERYTYINEKGEDVDYTYDDITKASPSILENYMLHISKGKKEKDLWKGKEGADFNALFACKYPNNTKDYRCQTDWTIYSCTIYENAGDGDVAIANFVPAYSKQLNKCGMYDTVRGRFFTNDCTYGADFFAGKAFSRGSAENTDKEDEYDDAGGESSPVTIDGDDYTVPAGYTPVDYVYMNGKKQDWFDLGMPADASTGARVDFCNDYGKWYNNSGIIWSANSYSDYTPNCGLMIGNTSAFYYYWGSTSYINTGKNAAHNTRHTVSLNYKKDRSVCLDGEALVTGLSTAITGGTANIELGRAYTSYFGGWLYSCIITQGYDTVMALTPVVRNRDNMAGLYDCINNEFYTPVNGSLLEAPETSGSAYIARQGEAVDLDNVSILHLWQSSKEKTAAGTYDDAKCMDSDGNIYRLYYDTDELKVKGEALGPVGTTGTKLDAAQPFAEMSYTFSDDNLDPREESTEDIKWLDDNQTYAKLDYIHGSGTDYIDTGIRADATTKIDFTAMIHKSESNETWTEIAGYNKYDSKNGAFTIRERSKGTPAGSVFWYMGNTACVCGTGAIPFDAKAEVAMGPEGYHVENLETGAVTADGKWKDTPVSVDLGLTITLMRCNPSGYKWTTCGATWYGAKIWKGIESDGSGGDLIFDGVPAQRMSDLKLGFYDRVTGKFFLVTGNNATGYPDYTEEYQNNGLDDINDVTGKKVDVKVFHNFSLVKAVDSDVWHRIEYRLYENNGYQMLVSPWQDSIYDSVIMRVTKADSNSGAEAEKTVSWLASTGELSSTWSINGVSMSGISEITNSRTASVSNNKAVIIYNDGTVKVVDYVKGLVIYTQSQNFWSYVTNALSALSTAGETDSTELANQVQPFTFASLAAVMADSTGAARTSGTVAAVEGTEGVQGSGETGDTTDGTANSSGGAVTDTAVYIPGEGVYGSDGELQYEDEEITYVEGDGIYAGDELIYEEDSEMSEEEEDELFAASGADSSGEDGPDAFMDESEDDSSDDEDAETADGTSHADGSSKADGSSETEDESDGASDAEGSLKTDGSSGLSDSAGEAAGSGKTAAAVLLKAADDSMTDTAAGGTASDEADGDTASGEGTDIFSDENLLLAAASGGEGAVVYDPATGKTVKLALAAGGKEDGEGAEKPDESTGEEESEETLAGDGESSKQKGFSVNYTMGHSMTKDEQSGFVFILAAGGAVAALLIVLFIGLGKRHRKHEEQEDDAA